MRGGMLVHLPRQDISLAVPINEYPPNAEERRKNQIQVAAQQKKLYLV